MAAPSAQRSQNAPRFVELFDAARVGRPRGRVVVEDVGIRWDSAGIDSVGIDSVGIL